MGLFDKIFQKSENFDDSANVFVLTINCKGCGKKFSVGEDAIINNSVLPADGAIQPMVNPDTIKIEQWRKMSKSSRETQSNLISGIMGSKMAARLSDREWTRIWKCPVCYKINYWRDDY